MCAQLSVVEVRAGRRIHPYDAIDQGSTSAVPVLGCHPRAFGVVGADHYGAVMVCQINEVAVHYVEYDTGMPLVALRRLRRRLLHPARAPERARRNAVNQLQRLDYKVTLTPAAASA